MKLKSFFILLLSALSLTAFAQKKIALLEPLVGNGSIEVSGLEKAVLRGELRKAITEIQGFEAFTRTDIDKILEENHFQTSGMVDDAQIKRLGELAGADYLCVSTITKSSTEFYLEAYLIDVRSGQILNPASQYGKLENGRFTNLLSTCQTLTKELLGQNKPILSIEKTSHDFGDIPASGGQVATFPVRNIGATTLHITKVNYDGNDYDVRYPYELKPGERGEIKVTVLHYKYCSYPGDSHYLGGSIGIYSDGGKDIIWLSGNQICN